MLEGVYIPKQFTSVAEHGVIVAFVITDRLYAATLLRVLKVILKTVII